MFISCKAPEIQYRIYTMLDVPVSCIYNTGIPESLIYAQYRQPQYSSSNNTGNTSIVKHTQYWKHWYFQYCEYYNTGNTSIVNITILVIPVSRPAASNYPDIVLFHWPFFVSLYKYFIIFT
jgi:hypothetical protein